MCRFISLSYWGLVWREGGAEVCVCEKENKRLQSSRPKLGGVSLRVDRRKQKRWSEVWKRHVHKFLFSHSSDREQRVCVCVEHRHGKR
jgi:hypothetical protein